MQKYGLKWNSNTHPLQIEFWMIHKGDQWLKEQGRSLKQHYLAAYKILWPEDDNHRWAVLALESMCENDITVFMGSSDSGKTYSMSKFLLVDWWAQPEKTLWLISSTEYRGAELRIWGAVKKLYNRARERVPWLAGHVLESMHAITTQDIDDDREYARALDRGLILVPSKRGNQFVGISTFIGVKAPRLRHAGDETQAMSQGFLDAYSNWYGKIDFKGIMSGNPTDITDPLCIAAEPESGWDSFVDTGKTQSWRSKFFNANVIAFDGRDSPNLDHGTRNKYPYLIGEKKLDGVARSFGLDSWQWFNQCVGKPNVSLASHRVITRQLCNEHNAKDDVIWSGRDKHTWLYAIDPSYGGIDRCIGIPIELGQDLDGTQIAKIHPVEMIPISLKIKKDVEDQLAEFVEGRLDSLDIPPHQCAYDSFGRGTLGYAFAKIFGRSTPIPIDAGGRPHNRPVRHDLFVEERDGSKRLKTGPEHYSKRVTQLWFQVREAIESNQIRGLQQTTIDEGCARTYSIVKNALIELETKPDYKDRTGRSPNEFDALAIGIELAIQRGFKIIRLESSKPELSSLSKYNWMELDASERFSIVASKQLSL